MTQERQRLREGASIVTERERPRETPRHTQQQQQTAETSAAWNAWADSRIEAVLARQPLSQLTIDCIGGALAEIRSELRKEFRGALEEVKQSFVAQAERLKAVPGKLPVAKVWQPETVSYHGELCCHEGALFQAKKNTAQQPGGSDWVCVARAGHDAIMPVVRGTYEVGTLYRKFNVAVSDGAAFIATRDDPGICPGDGWQLLSRQGKPGRRGERGERGERGPKGEKGDTSATIISWHIDPANYRVVPFSVDGAGPELQLRPLFQAFLDETSSSETST